MAGFEEDPKDNKQSFPCPECEYGQVTAGDSNNWVCNICDFDVPDTSHGE